MSLQFAVEDLISPLVSLSYLSSEEEDMDVDDPQKAPDEKGYDSDIEVIACYSEAQSTRPLGIAGRAMTTEFTDDDDLTLLEELYGRSIKTDTEPPSDLVDQILGIHPPSYSRRLSQERPIAECARISPIPDTQLSPPPHEQGCNVNNAGNPWSDDDFPYQPKNAHITGIAISNSGVCGLPNQVAFGDCIVFGKSFETIREEITFNFLEQTHLVGETYNTRLRRRNAFQAGMLAGSFTVIPRGVSQAAACDGNSYQVMVNENDLRYMPGTLPL